MKTKTLVPLVAVALLGAASTARPAAQGTASSYQGVLQVNGSPANNLFDMSFTLHDDLSGGVPLGAPVAVAAVPVTHGLFNVTLDIGANAFSGAARFLQISVRTGLSELRWLNIFRTAITDGAMPHVARLRHLEELYVGFTRVTAAGLRCLLPCPALRYLALEMNVITDETLFVIARMTDLEGLNIAGPWGTRAAVQARGAASVALASPPRVAVLKPRSRPRRCPRQRRLVAPPLSPQRGYVFSVVGRRCRDAQTSARASCASF